MEDGAAGFQFKWTIWKWGGGLLMLCSKSQTKNDGQGLISGVPQPEAIDQGMVSIWSVWRNGVHELKRCSGVQVELSSSRKCGRMLVSKIWE